MPELVVRVTLTDDAHAALARWLKADSGRLGEAAADHLRGLADSRLRAEQREAEYAAAEQAGRLYVARYWQHGGHDEEKFLTPQEAAEFLHDGIDDERFAAEGIFDSDYNNLGWSYSQGWPEGSPYRTDH